MNRLLAAALSAAAGAALAFAASFGVLALINATPDQPNTPLVTYETPGGAPRPAEDIPQDIPDEMRREPGP
ncbi:hypothetical protein OKJ48_33765 [Streptomyces kunmingensis]|uniref:Secreted protein n=1 Tax=Streptomyces kunmingensis TaxID=68225 RepID=A0ABU6CKA8_9ACTN|nr:hypothetical protein [Streptomyces kunmingensis]MEB3965156.1 hypothetical protein [Streptomyces kunmingensis]